MTTSIRSLLDYRVIIVTGKGGTGKTTVAASLAEAARRSGQRVALAETATTEAVAAYFEDDPAPLGYRAVTSARIYTPCESTRTRHSLTISAFNSACAD